MVFNWNRWLLSKNGFYLAKLARESWLFSGHFLSLPIGTSGLVASLVLSLGEEHRIGQRENLFCVSVSTEASTNSMKFLELQVKKPLHTLVCNLVGM